MIPTIVKLIDRQIPLPVTIEGVDADITLTVDGSAVVQPVSQSGSWVVSLDADALTYDPTGSEAGLVVRAIPNSNDLGLVRQLQVLTDEVRMLRRVFQDWSGMGDPRLTLTDNANIV